MSVYRMDYCSMSETTQKHDRAIKIVNGTAYVGVDWTIEKPQKSHCTENEGEGILQGEQYSLLLQ